MNRGKWRFQYDNIYDELIGEAVITENDEPSLTQQHHAKDADINEIMRRFGVTDGAIPPATLDPQYFGDFTDEVDFRGALDRTREALDRFNLLPADIRRRFGGDPVALWQFVTDPENFDEAIKLGLLHREAKPPVPPKLSDEDTTT